MSRVEGSGGLWEFVQDLGFKILFTQRQVCVIAISHVDHEFLFETKLLVYKLVSEIIDIKANVQGWFCGSVVEYLPSMCEALGSILSTTYQ